MDYVDYDVLGKNVTLEDDPPRWYPEKDSIGENNRIITYWDKSSTGHTGYHIIHLRNSKTMYSNYINYSFSNGVFEVWVSSSPAYSARQMEPDTEDSEYVNYVIDVTPIKEEVKAETRKVIKSVPYGGGSLGEIAN